MLRAFAALLCLPLVTTTCLAMTPVEQADAITYLHLLQEIRDKKVVAKNVLDLHRTNREVKMELHTRNAQAYRRHAISLEELRRSDIELTRARYQEKLKANYLLELDADYHIMDFRRAIALGDYTKIKPLAKAYLHRWEVKTACAQLEEDLAKANVVFEDWLHSMVHRLHAKNTDSFYHLIEERALLAQAHRDLAAATARKAQVQQFIKESMHEMERVEKAGTSKNPPTPNPAPAPTAPSGLS